MKHLLLCVMVVVLSSHSVSAQQAVTIDQTFSNITIPDSAVESGIKMAVKGGNTVILSDPDDYSDGTVWVNGVSYYSMHIPSDNPSSSSASNLVKFAENSNTEVVLCGYHEQMVGQLSKARARVTETTNMDSTILAISFHSTLSSSFISVKGVCLNDTVLYLLVDGLTSSTDVKVVLNNGLPQPGTPLTGSGAAFLKIDLATGAILKQVYLNHNPNDGWLNLTRFNTNSLTRVGNRFFFSSVSSLGENFMIHEYDLNLNLVQDIPILTTPYTPGNNDEYAHLGDMAIGYGVYNGQEYLGLIPKTVPVIVNLTTLDVNYINAGSALNQGPGSAAAFFIGDAFIFLSGGWIKRIELCNMIPSVIRSDFITNNPSFDGHTTLTAQVNARRGRVGHSFATLGTGQIDFYGSIELYSTTAPSGLYMNGQTITTTSLPEGDVLIYKGSITLGIGSHPGTETGFTSPDSVEPTLINGNNVIYRVDSTKLNAVHVQRTTGPDNVVVIPGVSDVVDFTANTSIVSMTMDAVTSVHLTTIRCFKESAIGIVDTSDISVDETEEIEAGPFYPNPFVDHLNIPEGYRNRDYELSIYDISGRLVFQEKNVGEYVLLEHLKRGMYVAHIQSGDNIYTDKIVKH